MTNYSLSEIDALSRKATRGAGYSWGLAEDAGKAVRWLSAYGLPGAEVLANLLQTVAGDLEFFVPELAGNECSNQRGAMCPLFCGAIINDRGHWLEQDKLLTFKSILSPLLALPQAARLTEVFEMPVMVSFGNAKVICTPNNISFHQEPEWQIKSVDLVCQKAKPENTVTNESLTKLIPSPLSRPVAADIIKILEHFAHKTYAPATETSRLAGAGAGLSDND